MHKVFGGPGCGKTTRLLQIVEQELADGVPPNAIAFVGFTRKAAHEALARAKERFGLAEDDLPFFRTLHSLAFRQLGLGRGDVMGQEDYRQIGEEIGVTFGQQEEDFEIFVGASKGDQCAYAEQLSRLTLVSLEQTCLRLNQQSYWDVKLYADCLSAYKLGRRKIDFTDMLERFRDGQGAKPQLRVVVVDEAQDLSALQWQVVRHICEGADRVYIGGDDDQAIYQWAGADVDQFIDLAGTVEVLPHSHRLPSKLQALAFGILQRIHKRQPKQWTPHREGGVIRYYAEPEMVDMERDTWLVLVRNRFMLDEFVRLLRVSGYPYVLHGKSSTDNEVTRAVMYWEALRAGQVFAPDVVRKVYARMVPGSVEPKFKSLTGAEGELGLDDLQQSWGLKTKADWMDTIRMPSADREYYRAVRRSGESMLKVPRITVSTIHQAKGGEADNVLLCPDMAAACYRDMVRDPDGEGRVFYVGATRAKEGLHLLYPRSGKYFEI